MATPLQRLIASLPCAFVTEKELPTLIQLDRLHPVLVRCGMGRFTCAAQDVEHMMKCVHAGGDYVRDVSIPNPQYQEAVDAVKRASQVPMARALPRHLGVEDYGGVFDGIRVMSDTELDGAPGF